MIIQSWDTAIKAQKQHDASACLTFEQMDDGTHHLLHVWTGRLEYPHLKRQMMRLAGDYEPDAILIEDKASGQSLIQDIRRESHLPVVAVQPKGDKLTRVAHITPMLEGGQVLLPHYAPWLAAFEEELLQFPEGAHDDQVDALSQYLNWVRGRQHQQLRMRRL